MEIPDDCDGILEPVPYPRIVKNEDLGVRSAKYAAALGQANHRIEEGRTCNQQVREAFSKGKDAR